MVFWTVLLDAFLAILLAVTIGYAVVLNRRLAAIRGGSELDRHATGFHDAVTRAEDSVARLKAKADDLQQRLDKADALREDLALLVERGERVADGLEATVRLARNQQDAARTTASPSERNSRPVADKPAPSARGPVNGKNAGRAASIDGKGRNGTAAAGTATRGTAPERPLPRSQAERELLAALAARK
ncbi:MAG: hypothetical protein EA405_05460 [Rhodospirillales bacterium]|nr:MAG: hypothetical protein EA405_05460 [Rhodospirillales bacterium]